MCPLERAEAAATRRTSWATSALFADPHRAARLPVTNGCPGALARARLVPLDGGQSWRLSGRCATMLLSEKVHVEQVCVLRRLEGGQGARVSRVCDGVHRGT